MTVIYLEGVAPDWLHGTPEEVKRANEILSRNWDILKSHIIPLQNLESPLSHSADKQELASDSVDIAP